MSSTPSAAAPGTLCTIDLRGDVPLRSSAPAAGKARTGGQQLLAHAFLDALHETGCATPRTGWNERCLKGMARAERGGRGGYTGGSGE